MKKMPVIFVGLMLVVDCIAATHYVVPPGTAGATATDPYTNWATAGTNIVEVVNAAMTNTAPRVVWVTNGTYYPTNGIYVTNTLTLRSVNGRDATMLNGSMAGTNMCAYITAAIFDGFTVTNYSPSGSKGTVCLATVFLIEGTNIVQNCIFVGNNATASGGGGINVARGASIITNCIFKNNYSLNYGGGVFAGYIPSIIIAGCRFEGNRVGNYYGGACALIGDNMTISNCVIVNNITPSSANGYGGGVCVIGGTNISIVNSVITGNAAKFGGGGISFGGQGNIRNCSIIGNISTNMGGGIYGTNMTIRNCLIALNRASTNGGGVWLTNSIVENCTIVSNYAAVAGGGVYVDGPANWTNNIIYFNTAASAANFTNTAGNTGLSYSCVIPAVGGTGNITNNPVLKDLAGGDYRLRMTSPCVNAGTNQPWMTNAVDLEGNARILKTIVDMGAYETRLWQGTIFRVP